MNGNEKTEMLTAAARVADLLDPHVPNSEYERGAVEAALSVLGMLDDDHRYVFETVVHTLKELNGLD